jgi:hypothetical protein
MIQCDFCGLEFDPNCNVTSCAGCPLAYGCAKITCPRCGYVMLPEAKLVGWVRSLSARVKQTMKPTSLAAPTKNQDTGNQA